MTICKRVVYSGAVQGVGFRYAAKNVARGFAVKGFVRNLPNGNVEVLAEGEQTEVERFLDAVGRKMAHAIQEQHTDDETPRGFVQFVIER